MKRIVYLLAFAALFAACSSDDNGPGAPEIKEIQLSPAEKEMAEVSPNFAIDLLQAVDATIENNEKFVVSPLSASMALSMAMNGAQGETYNQMAEALSFGDYSLDEINSYNNKLLTGLVALDNQAQIGIVNSLWLNNGFYTLAPYNNAVAKHYAATSETLELSSDYARNRINNWCNSNTNGLIPNYLEENLPSNVKLAIINALYFKCPWLHKFDKKNTKKDKFYAYDGTEQEVDFMVMDDDIECRLKKIKDTPQKLGNLNMLSLYFGKNKAFCIDFILPDKEIGIDAFMENFSGALLNKAYDNFETGVGRVPLRIPKLKIEFKEELMKAFMEMGITDAFDAAKADFGLLADEDLVISKVQQANVFSIDENGGEAASVTNMENITTSNRNSFIINRPFLFFVREVKTNTILFAGKVAKM